MQAAAEPQQAGTAAAAAAAAVGSAAPECCAAADQEMEGEEGEYDEEEEYEEGDGSSSEEEEDRREFGIYQCLPLEPPRLGEEGEEEEDGEECEEDAAVYAYLRQVRDEARHLPNVVTAAAPSSQQTAAAAPHGQRGVADRPSSLGRYLAADPGPAPCDPRLVPSAAWTRDFLAQFARLRHRLQREHELSTGQAAAGGAAEEAARAELAALSLDPPSALMPELQQLQGLDQLQVRRQLHSAIRAVVREQRLDPAAAPLLYALSARVEKPLHAGTQALYRELLRCCAAQRAGLADAGDPALPHLNVAITLAGAFFGQDEQLSAMWDLDAEEAALLG